MDKYRVITLSISGKAPRKIFKLGEIITQDNVHAPVADLVKGGYIEKAEEDAVTPEGVETFVDPFTKPSKKKVEEAPVEVEEEEKLDSENDADADADLDDDKKDEKDKVVDLTRKDMMASLDELGVEYNKNASKAELLDLYTQAKANKDAADQ